MKITEGNRTLEVELYNKKAKVLDTSETKMMSELDCSDVNCNL